MSKIAKIYHLIGKKRQMKIMGQTLYADMSEQEIWEKIIKFLDNDQKLKKQMLLFEKSNPIRGDVSVKTKSGQNGDQYKKNIQCSILKISKQL